MREWEDSIKMDPDETEYEDVNLIQLSHNQFRPAYAGGLL
jgi:hypothetical protein